MQHSNLVAPGAAPVAPPRDPLAVALGNASLLGVGYLILGRRWLAALADLVTVVLVTLLATVVRSMWLEIVVLVWWVALIAHGWWLARRGAQRVTARRQRLVALSVTVAVLAAFGLLRFDAARIDQAVASARAHGDCTRALTALDRVWFGHRVVDAPMTARGDQTMQACQRLKAANDKLGSALTGNVGALRDGFDGLASVLAELPGHEKMVDVALARFLAGLPTKNACQTAAITDWLRQRPKSNNALDLSAKVATQTAPAALVGCGDDLMATQDWVGARARYQQLLDQYPGHELAAKAQDGVTQATLAIELANVRGLLRTSPGTQPDYCSHPAQYSGAAPYGKGTNRALIYGNDTYSGRLPGEWRATDAADAVLVVCAGDEQYGTAVQTCPYESKLSSNFPVEVTFHKIAIPVRAYELRTGKVVFDTTVEIGGSSCPDVLEYSHPSNLVDIGPPPDVYVNASDADVRGAFAPLITP